MNNPDGRFDITESVLDFVRDIRRSQVLDEARCDEIEARVASGELTGDAKAVASALAREGVLTEYQARRILVGRVHGLVVGRYTILDRLGSGGMGQVYKAKHAMMGRTVALKFLANQHSQNKGRLARFRREMQLVGLLDHPNIVRAFDADQYGEVPYIVMEYVPGQTLDALLRSRGRLSVPEVLWFGSQVARGLDHAHKQGVLHRDIKPSNILFSRDRQVKLLDLGLGAFLERDPSDEYKTEAGATVGTMDYLSPEQACMKPLDGRSDIYSLGCTLYHLMTGRLPFEGDSSMERMAVRIIGRSVPIIQVMPSLPEPVSAVMDRMLAREPAERFQTAGELALALTALVRPKSGSGETPALSNGLAAGSESSPTVATPSLSPTNGRKVRTGSDDASPTPSSVAPSDVLAAPSSPGLSGLIPIGESTTNAAGPRPSRRWSRPLVAAGTVLVLATVGGLAYLIISPGRAPTGGGGTTPTATPPNPIADTGGAVLPPPIATSTASGQPPAGQPTETASKPDSGPVEQLVREGRWGDAATILSTDVVGEPTNLALVHRAAVALLMAGDTEACRRLTADRFAAVANQDNPGALDVIRACCLLPGNLPDARWPVELARKAVASDPKAAWRFYVLGLIHFRAGQDAEAVQRLNESIRLDPFWAGSFLNWPVLSLAHHRLGHATEAQTWLTKARERRASAQAAGARANADPPWYDRGEFEILLREAEATVTAAAK